MQLKGLVRERTSWHAMRIDDAETGEPDVSPALLAEVQARVIPDPLTGKTGLTTAAELASVLSPRAGGRPSPIRQPDSGAPTPLGTPRRTASRRRMSDMPRGGNPGRCARVCGCCGCACLARRSLSSPLNPCHACSLQASVVAARPAERW